MKKLFFFLATLFFVSQAFADCVIPTNGMTIDVDTTLCGGTYSLAGGATGAINITASGVAGNFLTLDCNGAIITGSGAYGIYSTGKDYLEIKNCTMLNYSTGSLIVSKAHNLITDNNFSSNTRVGSGIVLGSFAISDTNIYRNFISGRLYAISSTSNSYNYVNIMDNIFNDNNYGTYSTGNNQNYWDIERNEIKRSSNWAIYASPSAPAFANSIITPDNNFYGSANGIYIGSNQTIDGWDFRQWNIPGTQLTVRGNYSTIQNSRFDGNNTLGLALEYNSHTIVQDNNFTKTGAKGGVGVGLYGNTITDVNIYRNEMNNRLNGIIFSSNSHTYYNILDNNISYCTTGILSSATTVNYMIISRNTIINSSSVGISLFGSHHKVSDNNIDFIGTKTGTGIQIGSSGGSNFTDNNIIGNSMNNRVEGIDIQQGIQSYYFITDNNMNGNTYGIYYSGTAATEPYWTISRNNIKNATNTAILLIHGNYTTITNDNNLHGSLNGIYLDSNNRISGLTLQDQNITGIAIQLAGSHNEISDSNFSTNGTKIGIGVRIGTSGGSTLIDNNIFRNFITNRVEAIDIQQGTQTNYFITDNNLNNNTYGLYYSNTAPTERYFTILRNQITNSTTYGLYLTGGYHLVEDTNVSGSGTGIVLAASHNVIRNVNVSWNGVSQSGTGINPTGSSLTDNNFERITANNRVYGIQYSGGSTHTYNNIIDSNFYNNNYGITTGSVITSNIVVSRNNFDLMTTEAIYLNDYITITPDNNITNSSLGITVRNYNEIYGIRLDQNLANGLQIYQGSHNYIHDINVSWNGAGDIGTGLDIYCVATTLSDINIERVSVSNRSKGIYLRYNGTNAFNNVKITDSNFFSNINPIYADVSSNVNNPIISRNYFSNNSATSIYLPKGSATTINSNCFNNNNTKITVLTSVDTNYNYWSDWNGSNCNSDGVFCRNAYSFTGGTDYSPFESCPSTSCSPAMNVDWSITTPTVCTNKTLDIGSGSLVIDSNGMLLFVNSNLHLHGIQVKVNRSKLIGFNTGSYFKWN